MARIVETNRLFIRGFESIDAKPLFELSQDAGINQYTLHGYRFKDEAHAQKWIESQKSETSGLGVFPIFRKKEHNMIGLCALRPIELSQGTECEVMYRLAEPFRGKGYASEAASGLLDYGFIIKKIPKIVAIVMPENEPSKKVVMRLGMNHVGRTTFKNIEHELYEIHSSHP